MSVETLAGLLEAGADNDAALIMPDGPRLTHGELRREVARLAESLARHGIGRDDRVALVLPNGAEAVVCFLAAAAAGTAAPLNPAYTEEEFRFYLDDTDARAVVLGPGAENGVRKAAEGRLLLEARWGEGGLQLETLGGPRREPVAPAAAGPEDVALVLHTSGTTSRPKRVPLRQRNLAASVANITRSYLLGPQDVSLCVMPLFHVHGLVASTLSTLGSGGTVVVPRRFNAMGFWQVAAAQGMTWYSASPTIHELLLMRAGEARPEGARRLRFLRSCSSSLSVATQGRLEAWLEVPALDAYGMTEASHQMASNPLPPETRMPGSVGRGTGVEIGITDGDGGLLAPGTAGEVVVRGPSVIDAYESNPEANASSFRGGWFRTGDQGVLDGDGYLRLVGRIKELINRGGEKIAPGEIDEVLRAHPAVAEAVAFGVPHPTWGEEVAAAVVLRSPATEKEILAYSRERLADFKVPRRLFIVEAIPKTATGKVQRRNVAATLTKPVS